MSRIQDILNKAERDGTARRTRPLHDEYATRPTTEDAPRRAEPDGPGQAREFVDAPPAPRSHTLPPRLTTPSGDGSASHPGQPGTAAPPSMGTARPDSAAAPPPYALSATETFSHASAELDEHLVAALAPTSLAAEQYRSLRTRLKRLEAGRNLRTIAITSPSKGDGKSLTAANLALTMAQEVQQRVLLVDADLRRPNVHHLFGLEGGVGLGDVLMNMADLGQSLIWLPEHQLTVLPAGLPPSNPAELLGSATMRRVLDTLRTRFDRIVIDVPPVAPLADLHILAPMVDGLLMIVRAGITPKPAIERALAGLDPSRVLGLVLNEVGGEGPDTYNYEGYGYLAG